MERVDHERGLIEISADFCPLLHLSCFRLFLLQYAFEMHFDKINDCSLFSGLRSSIGWGRPNFPALFSNIAARHPSQHIGVFTSGGPRSARANESVRSSSCDSKGCFD